MRTAHGGLVLRPCVQQRMLLFCGLLLSAVVRCRRSIAVLPLQLLLPKANHVLRAKH